MYYKLQKCCFWHNWIVYCLNWYDLKPVEDSYRQLHRTIGEQLENSDDADAGGINIDEAKRRLQQADSIDKKLYRDRVQQKHRVFIHDILLIILIFDKN